MRLIRITTPGTRRAKYWQQGFTEFAEQRSPWDIQIIPWEQLIATEGCLDSIPNCQLPAVIQIESPGKSAQVRDQFLQLAHRLMPMDDCDVMNPATHDAYGDVTQAPHIHRAFVHVLQNLQISLDARPHLRATTAPRDIMMMFDKRRTGRLLQSHGIPTPDFFDASMQAILGTERFETVDLEMMSELRTTVDSRSSYIRSFVTVDEQIQSGQLPHTVSLELLADKQPDKEHRRRYNVPSTDEKLAILILGTTTWNRSIVVQPRACDQQDTDLQAVS